VAVFLMVSAVHQGGMRALLLCSTVNVYVAFACLLEHLPSSFIIEDRFDFGLCWSQTVCSLSSLSLSTTVISLSLSTTLIHSTTLLVCQLVYKSACAHYKNE